MSALAEYQIVGAGVVAPDAHDAEPVKPKVPRAAGESLDDKPLLLTKNLAGTIESVQSTKILIRYLTQLAVARRVARDPRYEPIKVGMTGVVDGTDIWFTITHAAGGHAVAGIQGHRPVRAMQSVSINPDDARLALIHSRRPPQAGTWGNHNPDNFL